jgi:hypothetical protein
MFKLVAVVLAVLCALTVTLEVAEARHLSRFRGGFRSFSTVSSKQHTKSVTAPRLTTMQGSCKQKSSPALLLGLIRIGLS